jgi:hypothetical protein
LLVPRLLLFWFLPAFTSVEQIYSEIHGWVHITHRAGCTLRHLSERLSLTGRPFVLCGRRLHKKQLKAGISALSGLHDVGGPQGNALSLFGVVSVVDGVMHPPCPVAVPEMVI